MVSYTKINVNLISFVISIIIFFSLNTIYSFTNRLDSKENSNDKQIEAINQEVAINNNETKNDVSNKNDKNEQNNNQAKTTKSKEDEWKIEIKAISLSAPIAEGTTDSVMNKYVGHFTDTSKNKGNIGLAAHNRGYPVNYFQNIKKLKKGDEIKYTYKKFKKTYIVDKIEIIKDEDWTYLKNTDDNRITLITCVENEPNYRRCIQGIEK